MTLINKIFISGLLAFSAPYAFSNKEVHKDEKSNSPIIKSKKTEKNPQLAPSNRGVSQVVNQAQRRNLYQNNPEEVQREIHRSSEKSYDSRDNNMTPYARPTMASKLFKGSDERSMRSVYSLPDYNSSQRSIGRNYNSQSALKKR